MSSDGWEIGDTAFIVEPACPEMVFEVRIDKLFEKDAWVVGPNGGKFSFRRSALLTEGELSDPYGFLSRVQIERCEEVLSVLQGRHADVYRRIGAIRALIEEHRVILRQTTKVVTDGR